jgi:thioredoxin-dependent peroxiredoxin
MLTVGEAVPDFSYQATNQQQGTLQDLQGQALALYFYPKDNTPGCTQESEDFRDLHSQFTQHQTQILGISRDSLTSHEKFKAKLQLPFELISDADEAICHLFDVIKLKNMYGKQVHGIERSTFLIDRAGILQHQWRKVKVAGHVSEVLEAARQLN